MKLFGFAPLAAVALAAAFLYGGVSVHAGNDSDKILEPLKKARPDFDFESVQPTQVKGIYRTTIIGGPTIYITEDGKHFFAGDFFEVGDNDIINIAEQEMEADRKTSMAALKNKDMIIFSPKKTKALVYVFTDVDCYYCQKLHREVPELNELGVEVRYLAYPRAGIGSASYRKIASAWCADDANDALTRLKAGEDIAENVCKNNPVAAQFKLGGRLGVTGTPALVTAEGKLLPGYMPAATLAKRLGL
ncbi:MAG: DsbC family protein [Gammaproteobacteria bacterium]|nr:DsbC family protein [Gammaproteobacteria bacterium]